MSKTRSHTPQRLALAGLLAATLSAVAGCGSSASDGKETSSNPLGLVSSGQLTVCTETPFRPFEYVDHGEYTGFDIDLAREIAERLDLTFEVKVTPFEAVKSGAVFSARTCDMAINAITITPERAKVVAFSDGYYTSLQSLLVREGSPIRSISDLAGKRVGVQQGATGQAYATENSPDGTDVVAFPDDATMFTALKAKSIDAMLQDFPINLEHERDGGFVNVEQFDTDEEYGIVLQKDGSDALLEAVNKQLGAMRADGSYDELYAQYFSE